MLVARPGSKALLLTATNAGDGFVALRRATDAAADERRAFCVELADDIFALDDDARAPAGAFDRLVTEVKNAGAVPVVIASGQPGHRHLFLRRRDRERWIARAKDLGFPGDAIRIDNARIRPPLSPHRGGLPVELLEPTDPLDALVALAPLRKGKRLSRRVFELLRHGDTQGRYKTRSEAVMAIVLGAVDKAWSPERVCRALCDSKNVGGAKVQDILARDGEVRARAYVEHTYRKAQRRLRESPPTHPGADAVRARVDRLRAAADTHRWTGTREATARRVIDVLWTKAYELGVDRFRMSDREVAWQAGCSRSTLVGTKRANKGESLFAWIAAHGWMARDREGGRRTFWWRLPLRQPLRQDAVPFPSQGEGGCEEIGTGDCLPPSATIADYFRRQWARWLVFEAVRKMGGSGTTAEISTAMGRKPRGVRHHLTGLHGDRVMTYADGRWALVADLEVALVRAAANRGTLGSQAWQRAQHRHERETYRDGLNDLRDLRADVLALAERQAWASVSLGEKVMVAPGAAAWRKRIEGAGTKELRTLKAVLNGVKIVVLPPRSYGAAAAGGV